MGLQSLENHVSHVCYFTETHTVFPLQNTCG